MTTPDVTTTEQVPLQVEATKGRAKLRYHRAQSDLVALIFAIVAVLALIAVEKIFPTLLAGFEVDLIRLFNKLPVWGRDLFVVITYVTLIVTGVALLVFVFRRRLWRIWGLALLAELFAFLLFWVLDRRFLVQTIPPELDVSKLPHAAAGATWPSTGYLVTLAAFFTVFNAVLPRKWRRAIWILYAFVLVLRIADADTLALDVLIGVAMGVAAGLLALFIHGRPDLRPGIPEIAQALETIGIKNPVVKPASVDARGSTPYFAVGDDGRKVFAKVLTSDERYNDVLFRTFRRVRFKGLGDEKPFSTLRRGVEHEAMLSLMAADLGVRTPRLVGIARVGSADALLLSTETVAGHSLDSVDPAELTDDVLRQVWGLIEVLHSHHIAHRDLRLANVFLDDNGHAWLIDFGFGEAAVTDDVLATDVAEFLASSAAVVGTNRAVDAAAAVLSPKELIDATARLQPHALSTATRGGVKKLEGGLDALRARIAEVTGLEAIEPVALDRIKPKTLITLVILGAAVYFLIPQLADIPGLFKQLGNAKWAWIVPVILASLATYAGAGLGLASSVAERISFVPALGVALAGSFVNRLAPVKVAGAALNVRFLQKRGVGLLTAVAGAGLIALAGFITHITVTLIAIVAAGSKQGLPFHLPNKYILISVAVGVLILVGLLLWIPRTAKLIKEKLVPAFVSTKDNLVALAQKPHKIVGLFSGGFIVPVGYVLCLYFSVQAFGGGVSLAQVAVVFLTIGALASAAPTPGGVGAVEAALIGGLSGLGMPTATALAAVFLYRLATFWFPVLPGWVAFTMLQRSETI